MSRKSTDENETLLSYLLKTSPHNKVPADASPHTLHPLASSPSVDTLSLLKNLAEATPVLSRNLQAYSSFSASEHKLISILRQSTSLIENLHTVSMAARLHLCSSCIRGIDAFFCSHNKMLSGASRHSNHAIVHYMESPYL